MIKIGVFVITSKSPGKVWISNTETQESGEFSAYKLEELVKKFFIEEF